VARPNGNFDQILSEHISSSRLLIESLTCLWYRILRKLRWLTVGIITRAGRGSVIYVMRLCLPFAAIMVRIGVCLLESLPIERLSNIFCIYFGYGKGTRAFKCLEVGPYAAFLFVCEILLIFKQVFSSVDWEQVPLELATSDSSDNRPQVNRNDVSGVRPGDSADHNHEVWRKTVSHCQPRSIQQPRTRIQWELLGSMLPSGSKWRPQTTARAKRRDARRHQDSSTITKAVTIKIAGLKPRFFIL
jgi:hypothetical protein